MTTQRHEKLQSGLPRRKLLGSLLVACCVLTAQSVRAEEALKVATVAVQGTPWSAHMDRIKKRVEQGSGGHYKVKVHYGGRLGGEKETVRETREGRIQMWGGSTAAMATIVPELYALEVPFLFESDQEADFVLDKFARSHVEKLLAQAGFVLYQLTENGWHGIGLKDRCVTGKDSLKGINVRSQEARVHLDTLRALGANAIEMSVPEVLPALKQGTVDGFSNTPLFSFAVSWYQGVKYFTVTNHVYQPALIAYSKKWFDAQSPERRKLLLAEVEADQQFGRDGVRAIREGLIENFSKARVQVCRATESQRAELRRATQGVVADYKAKASPAGKALFAAIERGKSEWAKTKKP